MVMVLVPLSPAAGVITTCLVAPFPPPKTMLALGTSVTSEDVAETVSPLGCVCASPMVNAIGSVGVFSLVDCGPMAEIVGGVLTSLTVNTKLVVAVKAPSLTVMVMVLVPLSPAAGVMTTCLVAPFPPPKTMLAFGTSVTLEEVAETVRPLGCVCASPMVNAIGSVGVFSLVDCGPMAEIVGGVLTSLTVKTKLVLAVRAPSLTVMVMVLVPLSPAAGVMTTFLVAPFQRSKTKLAFEIFPTRRYADLTVRPLGCVCASPMVNAIGSVGVFSLVDCGPMAEIVGGVLTSLTVNTKSAVAVKAPSLTVMVMVLVPLSPAAGVMTTCLVAPFPPPKTVLALGMRFFPARRSSDLRPLGCVCASPMVNAIGSVGVFSLVDCGPMAEIVGGVLTSLTVNTKLVLAVRAPSLTVMVMVLVPLSDRTSVV